MIELAFLVGIVVGGAFVASIVAYGACEIGAELARRQTRRSR